MVEFAGGGKVRGVGHGFDTGGEANLLVGKINSMNAEEERIYGWERFGKEVSVGGSCDDGDLLAMGCKQSCYVTHRDHMTRC
jgi:hypothetical protein